MPPGMNQRENNEGNNSDKSDSHFLSLLGPIMFFGYISSPTSMKKI
jgi:hypothetical protein